MAEMKSSFVFFLLLSGMAVCLKKEYIFMQNAMNWASAQTYCRTNYMDPATVSNDEENQGLVKAAAVSKSLYNWIGMNRTEPGLNIWQWSDREPVNFFKWSSGQPNNYNGIENCASVSSGGWHDVACANALPFLCFWRVALVNESKTWEEAREYCRMHYTGLFSPISEEQLAQAANVIAQTQTVSVWTGLHFVNGQWISVSRSPFTNLVSLPSCPSQDYRCGAFNTETNMWENHDCTEEFNFLCY
ncbi:C-type mannose receptor 2 [Silurus meridionalis]|uniref:C-type lectin domain-containing protein n=1 Tax=Silurus meridionalis TaxID=175797 RepID=A0A8T0BKD0_SILME|nr:hypothetical protein HF521_019200 [Silurus meridionalis]KAI5103796.1 C-type mannose receptor 2 [Silurus meridionalis]